MKVVVQRVKEASVSVNNETISKIQHGYLLLVGLNKTDTLEEIKYIARKIANLRVFSDENDWPANFIDTPEWDRLVEMAKEMLKAFNYKKSS